MRNSCNNWLSVYTVLFCFLGSKGCELLKGGSTHKAELIPTNSPLRIWEISQKGASPQYKRLLPQKKTAWWFVFHPPFQGTQFSFTHFLYQTVLWGSLGWECYNSVWIQTFQFLTTTLHKIIVTFPFKWAPQFVPQQCLSNSGTECTEISFPYLFLITEHPTFSPIDTDDEGIQTLKEHWDTFSIQLPLL